MKVMQDNRKEGIHKENEHVDRRKIRIGETKGCNEEQKEGRNEERKLCNEGEN